MVNYWKSTGIALVILGAALAVYGLTEYFRMSGASCVVASLCSAPDAAITYLIIPGLAMAVAGGIVLLTAPKKVLPPSPP